ncbi:MAG: hypothetical protein AAF993_20335, partial [Pseudomonadota bacterium]
QAAQHPLRHLALVAVIFGGTVMGLGNALQGYLNAGNEDPHAHHHHQDHHKHQAHQHHQSQAATALLLLPAHCMFCIDGMSPQHAALYHSMEGSRRTSQPHTPAQAPAASPAELTYRFHSRAPPQIA